jgi:hypothetical protein
MTSKSDLPRRIQCSRAEDWRAPEGATYVGSSSRWGNPFRVKAPVDLWQANQWGWQLSRPNLVCRTATEAVSKFVEKLSLPDHCEIAAHLCGRDLICWCSLDEPCHADVLLAVANCRKPRPERRRPKSRLVSVWADSLSIEEILRQSEAERPQYPLLETALRCDLGLPPSYVRSAAPLLDSVDYERAAEVSFAAVARGLGLSRTTVWQRLAVLMRAGVLLDYGRGPSGGKLLRWSRPYFEGAALRVARGKPFVGEGRSLQGILWDIPALRNKRGPLRWLAADRPPDIG